MPVTIDPFRAHCRAAFGRGEYPRTKTREEEAIAVEELRVWDVSTALLRAMGARSVSPTRHGR